MISRVAYLSLHTSPLLQPGSGDAGGMNVYIDELARTMAARGIHVDVFTRATSPLLPPVVDVTEFYRVIHIAAGPMVPLPVSQLTEHVFDYAESVIDWARSRGCVYDLVHSHYWLSGWAGLLVKRVLDIPLANSFHTLGRVKDATRRAGEPTSSLVRIAAEHEVIAGSDCVIGSTPLEADDLLEHYGADPTRLCVSPPGVNHDVFCPGDRTAARSALGVDDVPTVLFVGRIQALKGIDVATEAFEMIAEAIPSAQMLILGGPSGPHGEAEAESIRAAVASLNVSFIDPQPHHSLARYYQAADVLLFPSRSESFGLVAVESQSCATPVVAARVGGLTHAVSDGKSGYLIDGWNPGDYASKVIDILTDAALADSLSAGAAKFSENFSWDSTADRLLELYAGITE